MLPSFVTLTDQYHVSQTSYSSHHDVTHDQILMCKNYISLLYSPRHNVWISVWHLQTIDNEWILRAATEIWKLLLPIVLFSEIFVKKISPYLQLICMYIYILMTYSNNFAHFSVRWLIDNQLTALTISFRN